VWTRSLQFIAVSRLPQPTHPTEFLCTHVLEPYHRQTPAKDHLQILLPKMKKKIFSLSKKTPFISSSNFGLHFLQKFLGAFYTGKRRVASSEPFNCSGRPSLPSKHRLSSSSKTFIDEKSKDFQEERYHPCFVKTSVKSIDEISKECHDFTFFQNSFSSTKFYILFPLCRFKGPSPQNVRDLWPLLLRTRSTC